MVVYGEYLFLENFIAGLIILSLTGKLAGKRAVWWRLTAAGAICGVSGFMIFMPVSWVSISLRIGSALLISGAAFGIRQLIKTSLLFILMTTVSGGGMMAILLMMQVPALSGNGVLYISGLTYMKLAAGGAAVFGICRWFAGFMKSQKLEMSLRGTVTIVIGEMEYRLEGYADSGNSLIDPLSGKPVVLIDSAGIEKVHLDLKAYPERTRLIPYEGVGVSKGILSGVRVDRLSFKDIDIKNAIAAEYEGCFKDFHVLVGRQVLEGGLIEYGDGA